MIKAVKPFRNYTIDGKQIKNVIIYHDGVKVHESSKGWLIHYEFKDAPVSSDDVVQLDIDASARGYGENLSRIDHYITGSKFKGYTLYLHLAPTPLGKFMEYGGEEECWIEYCKFNVPARIGQNYESTTSINLATSRTYLKTPQGHEFDRIALEVAANGVHISNFDLRNILKVYNLVKKT